MNFRNLVVLCVVFSQLSTYSCSPIVRRGKIYTSLTTNSQEENADIFGKCSDTTMKCKS